MFGYFHMLFCQVMDYLAPNTMCDDFLLSEQMLHEWKGFSKYVWKMCIMGKSDTKLVLSFNASWHELFKATFM